MTTVADFKACGEVASQLAGGLNGLGGDEVAQVLAKASAAINLASGVANIAALAVSMMQRENVKDMAEAVATASAVSLIPVVGWQQVALATAVTAVAGATIGAVLTYKLRADLDSPSGVTAMGQTLGGLA